LHEEEFSMKRYAAVFMLAVCLVSSFAVADTDAPLLPNNDRTAVTLPEKNTGRDHKRNHKKNECSPEKAQQTTARVEGR
jgi:hypothetical protein